MTLKKIILFPASVIILVGRLTFRSTLGKRTILICQMSLIFILLSLNSECFAYRVEIKHRYSYNELLKIIKSRQICELQYNPSKTAAIVNIDCGSAYYINFKIKKTHTIIENWPSLFFSWQSDTVAEIESSCGTGCLQNVIFIAPTTVIACNSHQYRVSDMEEGDPNISSNRPLLIDPRKKIYICYDENDNIQVYPFPKVPTIYTDKDYFSGSAEIKNNRLIIHYENQKTAKKKDISYPL